MSAITIIGSGNMARAIGARAARNGHSVEFMSRDATKAQALADQLGDAASVGTYGAAPQGDLVVLAVLFQSAVDVVTQYGDALAGKTLVDITNPFNADVTGLATTPGSSMAQDLAAVAPASTHVVKAFNTILRDVLAGDEAVDVFFAGDDADAKARFAAFVGSLGLRPRDVGGLEMAAAVEWAGVLLVGVGRSGAGFDIGLGVAAV